MIRQWSSIYKDTTELIDASLTWYRSQICDKERVKLNISLFLSLFSRFNILISKRIAFPFLFSFDLDFRRKIFLSFSLSLYLSLVVFSKFHTKDRLEDGALGGNWFQNKKRLLEEKLGSIDSYLLCTSCESRQGGRMRRRREKRKRKREEAEDEEGVTVGWRGQISAIKPRTVPRVGSEGCSSNTDSV